MRAVLDAAQSQADKLRDQYVSTEHLLLGLAEHKKIAVTTAAVLKDLEDEAHRLGALRDAFENAIRDLAPDAVIFGADVARLPNTVAFSVPGLTAETALMNFDLAGIALSSGSACSSGKVKRSHVLEAMGIAADMAKGVLRLSAGWTSSEADVIRFREVFERILSKREKLIGRHAA